MEYRQKKIINIPRLDDCAFSLKNGAYGGAAGNKLGIIYNGEPWLLKYPKNVSEIHGAGISYSTSPLSEYLGSHIFQILGIPVHDTFLAERTGKVVVACKDFEGDGRLLEIRTLKNLENEKMAEMFEHSFSSTGNEHFLDLEELMAHLKYNMVLSQIPGIKDRFFEQAVVDILINNNDRNNGNWGVLRSPDGENRLAPVFDNGASFQIRLSESEVFGKLADKEKLQADAVNTATSYGLNGHHLSSRKFIEWAADFPEYRDAISRIVPLIREKDSDIRDLFTSLPEIHTTKDGKVWEICSSARKELFLLQMETRYVTLLLPEYEKFHPQPLEELIEEAKEKARMGHNHKHHNGGIERER